MTPTPPELLAPYKAAVVAAARDALRAANDSLAAGVRWEIPGTVPPAVIVIGPEAELGKLLRTPSREPMLGGRRAGDPPASPLTWDEPGPGPRSWTILLTSEGHGLVGAPGSKFETAHERHERLDVIEADPVLRQVTELQRENAELREKVATWSPAWTKERVEQLSKDIAEAVAKNASTVPQLTFPHIYLGLCDALLERPAGQGDAQQPAQPCWSCKRESSAEQRADADGNCPHCGVEIEQGSAQEGGAA